MVKNYQSGLETKEKIRNVSRTLFYQKGFRETSFGEICRAAEVNPGTIAYHFGSKVKIGEEIYASVLGETHRRIKELFPNANNFELMCLGMAVHMRMMFLDTGYRRFSAQILTDCIDDIEKDGYLNFSPLTYGYFSEVMSDEERGFFIAASSGADSRISAYIERNIDSLNFYETLQHYATACMSLAERNTLSEAIRKAAIITERMQISVDNFQVVIQMK